MGLDPLHVAVLGRAGTGALLDLGCGAGEFARFATDAGARVTGVDLDPAAVAAAAALVPEGSFAVGDAHDPPPAPFDTPAPFDAPAAFDAVVAVQLLEHVANPVAVLRAAPAPLVVATVWGRQEECDARVFGEALAAWLPPRPPRSARSGPPPLTEPDRLRQVVGLAGLDVVALDEIACPVVYADADAVVGSLLASGLGRAAANRVGPGRVRDAVLARMEPLRRPDGSYVLTNLVRVLTARRGAEPSAH